MLDTVPIFETAPPHMQKIECFPVHPDRKSQWGAVTDLLPARDHRCKADEVFRYLNRPLPDGVDPDDLVDVSAALPPLYTVAELAAKAGMPADEVECRLQHASFSFDDARGGTEESPKFYWSTVESTLTLARLTISAAAEKYRVDRRTCKKYLNWALEENEITPPAIVKKGDREYKLFWQDDIERVLKNQIRGFSEPEG